MKYRAKTIEAMNTILHDVGIDAIVVSKSFASVAASLLLGELQETITPEIKNESKNILMTNNE